MTQDNLTMEKVADAIASTIGRTFTDPEKEFIKCCDYLLTHIDTLTKQVESQKEVVDAAMAQAKFMTEDLPVPLSDDTIKMFERAAELQQYIWATTNAALTLNKPGK